MQASLANLPRYGYGRHMADDHFPPPTLAAQVVEHALGMNLHDWLHALRRAGTSWRQIAKKIRVDTGYDRHEDTVRSWYPDLSSKRNPLEEKA